MAKMRDIIEQKDRELRILHQVARYISSGLDLKELLGHIVEIAIDLTSADSCLIYIYEKAREELVLMASKNPHPEVLGKIKLKLGEGVTGWAAKEKKPVVISSKAYNDPRFKEFNQLPEDRFETFLSVPILSDEELIGVINLQDRDPRDYPEYKTELLFTIAKYLGTAVSNAFNSSEVKKKIEQIDILSKISSTIISNEYLNEILQLIVTMTAKLMKSKICSIMLLNEKKQELVIAATQSLSDDYRNKPNIKVGQSVSGKVVREKRPITVLNVTRDRDFMYPKIAEKEGIVSMIAVPMMIKDRAVGVINSYTDKEHDFTAGEIDILQAIANQAAAAIENTRLNEEVFKAKEELESRKVIDRAKGILMKDHGISEDEAYKMLQRKSMDIRKSMKELAEAVILAANMKNSR
ncbi:MAG: GAF domain-containing protein [Elusimicrobia bacterium]|nr:GAF domain-containing protein [Elusimicrobiota bacterium]